MTVDERQWDDRRRRSRLYWGDLTRDERLYATALLLGLLLLFWGVAQALQAQGRFPVPVIRLPNLDDVSLPGRPVLVPAIPPTELLTATSQAAGRGTLVADARGQAIAVAELGTEGLGRELVLVMRVDLPRVLTPPPPVDRFAALRLLDVTLVDARTGEDVRADGIRVDVRVAIRPIDLEHAKNDPSRLLLLHFKSATQAWEDTHARVEQGFLVAQVDSLSPFAVGVIEETPPPFSLPGLPPLGGSQGATSTPASTETPPRTPATPPAAEAFATASAPTAAASPTAAAQLTPPTEPSESPASSPEPGNGRQTPVASPLPSPPAAPPSPPGIPTPTQAPPPTSTPVPTATRTPGPLPEPTATPTPVAILDITSSSAGGPLFNVPSMKPGDTVSADLIIQNNGNVDFTYTLTIDATTSSLLDRDALNGLQLTLRRCGASFTLCTPIHTGPAVVTGFPMGGPQTVGSSASLAGLRPTGQDFLRMEFTFPGPADNTFQGKQSVLRFTWIATHAP